MTSVKWNSLPSHFRDIKISQLVFKTRQKIFFLEIQLKLNVEISNAHLWRDLLTV